ncbi:MAG: TetR/AcrR family transcriptional regulator [Myxococcota bacterium]|nr:TetR/AcrR family transcriptional regulator [Myxococcota bacterium]
MARGWGREEQPGLAAERILDAAEKAFIELGVSAAGMAEIARYAGCSRGTLYRYFPTRHDLHLAYVERATLAINERLRERFAHIEDPRRRLTEAILGSLQEVRRDPGTAAWFEPGASGMAARMSRSSEVVETLNARFVSALFGAREDDPDGRLRARWLARVVVSLLAMPGESEAEERELVERFVAPLVPARTS